MTQWIYDSQGERGITGMTIYICDDSKSDLLRLNHHLQEYLSHQDQKITIESFQSGEELLRRYEETMEKPSLIFLDIYMDDPDGMSVAHTLREEHYEGGLIFTTSSMEHAMDSYNVDALYYLQKPYDHEDFMNAIRRCTSIFEGTSKQYRINVQGKELQIPLRDILYFETGRHVTLIHTLTDTISITKVLSEVCEDFEQNPYWIQNRIQSKDARIRLLLSLSANLKVTDWLTLQARGNLDYSADKLR